MAKLMLISGSLRGALTNSATMRTAAALAPDGVETTIYGALGRLPHFNPDDDPSDVADVCLFLASPLARYVTGADILVHGGGERPAYIEAAKGTVRD